MIRLNARSAHRNERIGRWAIKLTVMQPGRIVRGSRVFAIDASTR